MAGTYTQIYIQYVFAVKGRENLLKPEWRQNVFKYMSGIIREKNQKAIIVNGVSNHVHAFVGLKPSMRISDLARDIKNNSSNFINSKRWLPWHFQWQEGYGAFSYGHSQLDDVYRYIQNQEQHHKKRSFREEYLELLKRFEIEFQEPYLFEWYDDEPEMV